MGYLSCNAESAIATCDSYNFTNKSLSNNNNNNNKHFNITKFSYEDLEASTQGFSHSNFLGKGSHGSVYRAILDGGALIAAVKRTTPHHQLASNITSPADNEIETLSRVRSPRLVNLLGFGSDPIDGRKLIVVEYMPNGSLYDLLHNNNNHNNKNNNSIKPVSLAKRVRIAIQVAKAVHHLHSSNPPVIHRDIKSSNVLFDGKFKARLGDFGLALRGNVEDVKVQCTPPAGTLGYLDPSYLAPSDLSAKSDVFSFGILLLEIFSGRNAIDLNYSPPSVIDWAIPLIRSGDYSDIFDRNIDVSSNESAVRQLAVLAARCVKSTAEKRPTMAEVVERLISASKRITSPVWNSFGRVRRRVRVTPPPIVEYTETVKVTSVILKGESNGGDEMNVNVTRSKSIGCVEEIECCPLDKRTRGRMGLGMMKMSRSKSTGELREMQQRRNGGIVLEMMIKNPNVRELESSKLLVKFR
ncbi:hypothetical protein QVD17_34733 [Tagetes erecta]|uniref:Protein kinase domain-containing protein n=1 Tax=Tagetes erecta TaxID=13708 RepID=A0AAD8K0X7_TARER|nr:hypothetical protein QVD17_34733 [Tagetes erecta]